jgi:hypothetical protein
MAFVVLTAGLAQTGEGHAALQDLGLFQTPTSYTELAFTTPRDLPAQMQADHAPIKVSFGIHNVSGSSQDYHWSITLVQSAQRRVSASGVTSAQAQGRVTVARTVDASCSNGRLQVVVGLAAPAESINFWVTCP